MPGRAARCMRREWRCSLPAARSFSLTSSTSSTAWLRSRSDMPTVLSVQSWVACGNVGNTAALFPLQRLGCETWSLNTVAFSNHTGYGKWRGAAVPASEIATLFEGIAELGVLPRCDAVLSGYLGEAEAGPVLLDIVARVKQANPRALFACDPLMGDVGPGWYVRAGVPAFYHDRTIAALYGVIEATMHSPDGELALVAAQDEFRSPSRSVAMQQL